MRTQLGDSLKTRIRSLVAPAHSLCGGAYMAGVLAIKTALSLSLKLRVGSYVLPYRGYSILGTRTTPRQVLCS